MFYSFLFQVFYTVFIPPFLDIMKLLNFGSLNVRGLKKITHEDNSCSLELTDVLKDVNKLKLDALGIQETHFGEPEYLQKEQGFYSFFINSANNRFHGTGILVINIRHHFFSHGKKK